MKIEPSVPFRIYSGYQAPGPQAGEQAAKALPAQEPMHTDKISIRSQSQRGEFGRLTGKIASELFSEAPAARVRELKNAVENGEYYVPSGQLADAILDRMI